MFGIFNWWLCMLCKTERNKILIARWHRRTLCENSNYRLNHTTVVKLYHPYTQFPRNVRLSRRRIVTFSAHHDFLSLHLINTLTQWRRQLLKLGGGAKGVLGRKSVSGAQGQSPGGGLGRSPQTLKQYANLNGIKPSYKKLFAHFTLFGVHTQYWLGLAYTTNHCPPPPPPRPLNFSLDLHESENWVWRWLGQLLPLLPPPPRRRHCS